MVPSHYEQVVTKSHEATSRSPKHPESRVGD